MLGVGKAGGRGGGGGGRGGGGGGGVQRTCSEATEAAAEVGAVAAGVEEMAVTKEGMACASISLGRHAPGPAPPHHKHVLSNGTVTVSSGPHRPYTKHVASHSQQSGHATQLIW